MKTFKVPISRVALPVIAVFILATSAAAQTTAFTYQGRLSDSAASANATYDLQFTLYDAADVTVGSSVVREDVQVTNGVFTVQLDFGAGAFPGADRFLEIAVRRGNETGAFTPLSPRQPITSTPYAIKSLNATNVGNATNAANAQTAQNAQQLGGVAASQYVLTNDARLFDARTPIAGNSNYIQNTIMPQSANFNISGNGSAGGTLSANAVNALVYKSFDNTVLTFWGGFFVPELHVGLSAGKVSSGYYNSFVGSEAAGLNNTTGIKNSFFGTRTGEGNTTGSNNTLIGEGANVGLGYLTYATAIGSEAVVRNHNTIVLGRENGSDFVRIFGLGSGGSTQLCRNVGNEIST